MNGRIALNLTQQDASELQPALAFIGVESELRFLDVEMSGELSDFTLDVFERPAAEAFIPDDLIDSPRVALARFTVLPPDHPDVLWVEEISSGGACPSSGCTVSESWNAETLRWCTSRGEEAEHCFEETVTCRASDASPEDCEVTTAGDPSLRVEQVSLNYMLMYIDAPAAPDSVAAYLAGARDNGLAAGYHLLAVEQQTDAEIAQGDVCEDQADQLTLQRYNAEHGTSLTLSELDTQDERALDRLRLQAIADLDCHATDEVWKLVADPAAEHVQIRIGAPANGSGFF
jgi:hypothetical protein